MEPACSSSCCWQGKRLKSPKYPHAGQQDHGTRRDRSLELRGSNLEGDHLPEAQQQTEGQQDSRLDCNGGLKTTPQGCHLAVINHTGQHVGNPLTQGCAQGRDLPLGRCWLTHPGFQSRGCTSQAFGLQTEQSSGLAQLPASAQGCGRWREGSRAELPCRAVAPAAGRGYPLHRTPCREAPSPWVDLQDHPPGERRGPTAAGVHNFGAPQEFAVLGHATSGRPTCSAGAQGDL